MSTKPTWLPQPEPTEEEEQEEREIRNRVDKALRDRHEAGIGTVGNDTP